MVSPRGESFENNVARPSAIPRDGDSVLVLDAMETLSPEKSIRLESGDEVEDVVMDEIHLEWVVKIG